MRVVPLAADSLGVRSMATFVEAGGTGLLLDPGATLAPSRYQLPPAAEEWEALGRALERIAAWACRADLVFVSHYHEDHFRPDPALYAGRRVWLKDPRRMVEGVQARRARELWRTLEGRATLRPADGALERAAGVVLEASPPLAHGLEGTTLGYLTALTVTEPGERERFVFAADVQGPLSPVVAAWLERQRPTLVYLAGPPSYVEHEVGPAAIDRAIDHVLRLVERTGCRVIMDHHAVRDPRAPERFARLWETGRVVTAAGWLGLPERPLEARRAQLWGRARRPAARVAAPPRAMIRPRPVRGRAKGGFAE